MYRSLYLRPVTSLQGTDENEQILIQVTEKLKAQSRNVSKSKQSVSIPIVSLFVMSDLKVPSNAPSVEGGKDGASAAAGNGQLLVQVLDVNPNQVS